MKVDFPDSPVPRIVNKQLNKMQTTIFHSVVEIQEVSNMTAISAVCAFCEINGRDEFK